MAFHVNSVYLQINAHSPCGAIAVKRFGALLTIISGFQMLEKLRCNKRKNDCGTDKEKFHFSPLALAMAACALVRKVRKLPLKTTLPAESIPAASPALVFSKSSSSVHDNSICSSAT